MRYIGGEGDEYLDLNAKYINNPNDGITRGSIVSAKAIEILLRELYNAVTLTDIKPDMEDLTQLYQAIVDRGFVWSDKIDYRHSTLILGLDDRLYIHVSPSGPNIVDKDGYTVGPKNPSADSTSKYWEEFSVFKDNGVINLANAVKLLEDRLENIEPQIGDIVDLNVQPLLDMHTNNGISTTTSFGHMKGGSGISIDNGSISTILDTNILIENNKLIVNQSEIVPIIATSDTAGIILPSTGLSIKNGIVSLSAHASADPLEFGIGTYQNYGHVKITDDIGSAEPAASGVGASPYCVDRLYNSLLGILEPVVITTSREFIVAKTATYEITVVGGGGNGGSGGNGFFSMCNVEDGGTRYYASGGGGGGGGAGETITTTVTLTKGTKVQVTIGGSGGGTTSFGSHATARGGGNGSTGGNSHGASGNCSSTTCGSGGSIGTNYGVGGTAGTSGVLVNGGGCIPAVTPGYGGTGARSIQDQYGHGGNGGNGQTNTQECKDRKAGPYGGTAGTQGVCIIKIKQ